MSSSVQLAPEFRLTQHDVIEHDEVDVYGLDHTLVYESDSKDDMTLHKRAIVMMRSGGKLNEVRDGEHSVRYRGWMAYPLGEREARVEGNLITNIELDFEELEMIGAGLVHVLEHRYQNKGKEEA